MYPLGCALHRRRRNRMLSTGSSCDLVAVCFVATRPRDRCDASIGGTTVANRARAWLSWLIGLDADLGTSCIRPTAPENAAVLEAHIINTSNTLAVSDSLSHLGSFPCYLSSCTLSCLSVSVAASSVMALSQSPRKVPLPPDEDYQPRPKARSTGSNITRRVFLCGVVVEGADSGRELSQGTHRFLATPETWQDIMRTTSAFVDVSC